MDSGIPVFDIGGTWFRTGVFNPSTGSVSGLSRVPAIGHEQHPDQLPKSLQRDLVGFIARVVRPACSGPASHGPPKVGISMGAALNAHDGFVYGSGPLWGPAATPFDLRAALQEVSAQTEWHIINDVTAALAHYCWVTESDRYRKALLVTISSGIACRVYDKRLRYVPVDDIYGLQGEIGHLPVHAELDGSRLGDVCGCGKDYHLNSVSSGQAVIRLLGELSRRLPDRMRCSELRSMSPTAAGFERLAAFKHALGREDRLARDILDAIIKPLAEFFRVMLTLDPELDRIVLTGGLLQFLHPFYFDGLLRSLERDGLYILTDLDPGYFSRRLFLVPEAEEAGMLGAGLLACGLWPPARA